MTSQNNIASTACDKCTLHYSAYMTFGGTKSWCLMKSSIALQRTLEPIVCWIPMGQYCLNTFQLPCRSITRHQGGLSFTFRKDLPNINWMCPMPLLKQTEKMSWDWISRYQTYCVQAFLRSLIEGQPHTYLGACYHLFVNRDTCNFWTIGFQNLATNLFLTCWLISSIWNTSESSNLLKELRHTVLFELQLVASLDTTIFPFRSFRTFPCWSP